jgi:AcrR family transcriptional regulator
MPQRASVRGEVRRQAMLEAARELFLERGFAQTSVADVVRRSGGSLATLYGWFGSKEGLFEAIIAEITNQMLAPLQAPELTSRDLAGGLEAFGQRFLDLMVSPDAIRWHRLCVNEGATTPALREAMVRTGPGRVHERLAEYLTQQAAAGRLRLPPEPEAARRAAQHFLALVKSESYFALICGEPVVATREKLAAEARRAVAVFLHGYAGSSS